MDAKWNEVKPAAEARIGPPPFGDVGAAAELFKRLRQRVGRAVRWARPQPPDDTGAGGPPRAGFRACARIGNRA